MKAAILALAIALSSCIAVAQDLNSYPPEIQAALKEAEDECKSGDEDGKFTLKPGAVTKLDLTGSKRGDYIIDLEHASCSTFESVFCGTGGCLLSIFVATKSGKLKRVFSDPVRVYKISKAPGPKTIFFDIHGGFCGKAGPEDCPKKRRITEQPFSFK